jgi:hypothetical protein
LQELVIYPDFTTQIRKHKRTVVIDFTLFLILVLWVLKRSMASVPVMYPVRRDGWSLIKWNSPAACYG